MLSFNGEIAEILSITPANPDWKVASVNSDNVVVQSQVAAWAHVRLNTSNRDVVIPLVAGRGSLNTVEGRSFIIPPKFTLTPAQHAELLAPKLDGTFAYVY
jgi:hypothetical protein